MDHRPPTEAQERGCPIPERDGFRLIAIPHVWFGIADATPEGHAWLTRLHEAAETIQPDPARLNTWYEVPADLVAELVESCPDPYAAPAPASPDSQPAASGEEG